mgnify:CR=1 FL=1
MFHDATLERLTGQAGRLDALVFVIGLFIGTLIGMSACAATPAALHGDYAPDYWATFFTDPDGIRLEVTNYRAERRERHDHWDAPSR